MRKLVIGCAVTCLIAVSATSEAKLSAIPLNGRFHLSIPQAMDEYGVASWYGKERAGRLTASGEPFDIKGLTAAHRDLPLGTTIKVTNLANSRTILLRVNDRGPGIPGRLIDVSWAAAKRLGFLTTGLTRVRVQVVPPQRPSSEGR